MGTSAEAVRVKCAGCGSTLKAPAKHGGKVVNCPKCGQSVKLPRAGRSASGVSGQRAARSGQRSDRSRQDASERAAGNGSQDAAYLDDEMFDDDLDDFSSSGRGGNGEDFYEDLEEADDFDDFDDYGAAPPRPRRRTAPKPAPKKKSPARRRKKKKKSSEGGAFAFESRLLGAGVLGGLGAMAGAVIWFVVGLKAGVIFFYPPVLFVIGLVACINGLFGGD